MLYFAYYDDEDCIQDYMLCDANNEKDAIQKFVEGRFSGITICRPERLKAKRVNRPVEDISNAKGGRMSHPDTKDQETTNWLRSENAYLKGKIAAYENFLKGRGYIKEEG